MKVPKRSPEDRARQQRRKAENDLRLTRTLCRAGILLFACLYGAAAFVPIFWNETGGRGYYILSYYAGVPLGLTVILVGLFYLARRKTTLALLITLALAVGVSIPLYLFRRLALHSTWDPAQKFLVWTVGLGLALVVFFAGISLYNLLRLRTQQRRYQVLLRLHADRGWIASGSREG